MNKPFVISIAAQSGGGKTTTVNALKERLANSAVIYWDDYGNEVDPVCDINDVFDYNEWNTKPLATDIERLIREPYDYVILDYPFGYLNDGVGKYIDMSVFIDTPLDVALARRIIRDYTSRSAGSDFGLGDVSEVSLKAIDNELRWYLTHSRPTYVRFSEMHKPKSYLIVNGMKSPEDMADDIVKSINIAKNQAKNDKSYTNYSTKHHIY